MNDSNPSPGRQAAAAQEPLTFMQMSLLRKVVFVLKVIVFVCTFGFVFPNVMIE